MAQNDNDSDFQDFMVRNAELLFPRLKDTYRFNSATKRSEPCTPTTTNAAWSAELKVSLAVAKELHAQMKAHYEKCRARNKKLPDFSKIFGFKKLEDGTHAVFSAKKKGVSAAGQPNKRPTVIDHAKQAWPEDRLDVWSGTTANVRVRAFPTVDPDAKGGISLLLDVVQILKPAYGGGASLDGFDEVEGEGPAEFAGDPFEGNKKTAADNKAALGDEF